MFTIIYLTIFESGMVMVNRHASFLVVSALGLHGCYWHPTSGYAYALQGKNLPDCDLADYNPSFAPCKPSAGPHAELSAASRTDQQQATAAVVGNLEPLLRVSLFPNTDKIATDSKA